MTSPYRRPQKHRKFEKPIENRQSETENPPKSLLLNEYTRFPPKQRMSQHVTKCREVSSSVAKVSPSVVKCREMSPNVTKCQSVSCPRFPEHRNSPQKKETPHTPGTQNIFRTHRIRYNPILVNSLWVIQRISKFTTAACFCKFERIMSNICVGCYYNRKQIRTHKLWPVIKWN